jgi:hypothetical protein
MDADRPKLASEHDREHFRKIGRWKAESHREAFERHMALSLEERLVFSLGWTLRELPGSKWGRDEDDPSRFYDRARRLGLYRD